MALILFSLMSLDNDDGSFHLSAADSVALNGGEGLRLLVQMVCLDCYLP